MSSRRAPSIGNPKQKSRGDGDTIILGLSRLHETTDDRFGLGEDGYWEDRTQAITPIDSWPEFFRSRRIEPRLRAAVDSGNLPESLRARVRSIQSRLDVLCGPAVAPSLLHGDAHIINIICTASGPVFVDPAPYFGHREMDLAYLDLFSPAPRELYQGYGDVRSIDEGFPDQKPLWLIPVLLAMVQVVGQSALPALDEALGEIE